MTDHDCDQDARHTGFDERGIALQTVIIMVVLLAIAGGIAAVLLSRGSEASNELQAQSVSVSAYSYGNAELCDAAGNTWTPGDGNPDGTDLPVASTDDGKGLRAAGVTEAEVDKRNGYCKP